MPAVIVFSCQMCKQALFMGKKRGTNYSCWTNTSTNHFIIRISLNSYHRNLFSERVLVDLKHALQTLPFMHAWLTCILCLTQLTGVFRHY